MHYQKDDLAEISTGDISSLQERSASQKILLYLSRQFSANSNALAEKTWRKTARLGT